jgi:hypothetical protein
MKKPSIFKKTKPSKILNGKEYKLNQGRKFNAIQEAHIKGELDVHAPIEELGMSIAQHWREDFRRRLHVKSTRNR